MCRFSNAVDARYRIPSPRFQKAAYIQALLKIIQESRVDFLIPTWEDVLYISAHLDQLSEHCEVFASAFELIHRLHNKWLFNNLARTLGFDTPVSHLIDAPRLLQRLDRSRDWVIKPCYSRATQGIHFLHQQEPLPTIEVNSKQPWIAQEKLVGRSYCSYSICRNGVVRAHTCYPVNYTVDGSSCLLYEAIKHSPIKQWVERFVALSGYTGQIAFDFIESDDGRLCAIECNPRGTCGLHLFSDSPTAAEAFIGSTLQAKVLEPAIGSQRQLLAGMLLYARRNLSFSFVKTVLSTPDVLFSKKDILPTLMQPVLLLKFLKDAYQYRVSLPDAYTHDLDWNGPAAHSSSKCVQGDTTVRPRKRRRRAATAGAISKEL